MKIMISPTKQMVNEQDFLLAESTPDFLSETTQILETLRTYSFDSLKKLWKCSDTLVEENYDRVQHAQLNQHTSPAIMSYKGLQYQYMTPSLLSEAGLYYLQANVRILSGFYGVLRPFDGIVPYRLEMQAPLSVNGSKHLYDFWGKKLYDTLFAEEQIVINLASKEYSKAITPYLQPDDRLIEIAFLDEIDGKLKVKATFAKMARGEMVRYLAENQITTLEGLTKFENTHYQYSKAHSTPNQIVFLHQE